MASVDIEIAARRYSVACRDGEEAHLRSVAALVDEKAQDAAGALGNLGEARQLLFASLLLADELKEKRGDAASRAPVEGDFVAESLERLADRIETLAGRLESAARSA
jgi:cell division protein ZapA